MPVSFDQVLASAHAAPRVSRRVRYGDGPLSYGDLTLPSDTTGSHPVVVFIHGGCWQSQYTVDHVAGAASALAAAGLAVWAPEYRRLGDSGGGWPGTFDDVESAIEHLSVLAREFPLEPARVVYAGHSAGGQLALWAASRPVVRPAGVLALAAISDLTEYASTPGGCNASVEPLLGGSPRAVPERYAATSPIQLLPSGVRSILVHGTADPIVPIAMSRRYVEAAKTAGDDAELVAVADGGHFDVIHPGTEAWGAVLAALNRLLPTG